MFKDIYYQLDLLLEEEDFVGTFSYLMSLPWLTRHMVYWYSYLLTKGKDYRSCYLSIKLIKYIMRQRAKK